MHVESARDESHVEDILKSLSIFIGIFSSRYPPRLFSFSSRTLPNFKLRHFNDFNITMGKILVFGSFFFSLIIVL